MVTEYLATANFPFVSETVIIKFQTKRTRRTGKNQEKKTLKKKIEREGKGRGKRCLGFVDARTMIGEHFLALGVDAGIGGLNVASGGVDGGGGIVLGRISHGGVGASEMELGGNWKTTRSE